LVFPHAPFLRFGQITQEKTELAATPTTAMGKTEDEAQAKQDTAEIHSEGRPKSCRTSFKSLLANQQ